MNDLQQSLNVIELENTARSAKDAAMALNVPVGAIVKTLVFLINYQNKFDPVVTLIAGDKQCKISVITKILKLPGKIIKPDASKVKEITGYTIGGVSPVALPKDIKIIMDTSLKRFDKIWSAAGHSHCVFPSTFEQLHQITHSILSSEITN